MALTEFIKDNTKENDVVIFKGFEWNSRYAFYCQRKVLMAKKLDLNGAKFGRFLQEIRKADLNVGAVVFKSEEKEAFMLDLTRALGKKPENAMLYGSVMVVK